MFGLAIIFFMLIYLIIWILLVIGAAYLGAKVLKSKKAAIWAGIEPGTYTGASAHGNGWQYKIVVTNSTPLYDPAAINAGVSHYSYNSDNFNASFNMRISYSHPSWSDGQFILSNGVYFDLVCCQKH